MNNGEEFNSLERELRQAMRREEPGAGFAERVLIAAQLDDARRQEARDRRWRWLRMPRLPRMAWAAVLGVAIITGIAVEREQRRRIEGEHAKEQLMLALRVTGTKLHQVRSKVREVSFDAGLAQ